VRVRYLGFPLRLPVNKEDLSEPAAAAIIRALQPPNYGVAITYQSTAEDIVEFMDYLGASLVQLHGGIASEELTKLKHLRPHLTVIKSLVIGERPFEELVDTLQRLGAFVDAWITDTFDPATGASGATGKLHDWQLSRRLVELATKPVILAGGLTPENVREATLGRLLEAHLASLRGPLIAWYYTPMMLPFSRGMDADVTVFDAMDELSKFKFAPARLLELEQELIDRADMVFTGGLSLYEAKKDRHERVHCFPSSVDRAHFCKARARLFDPADQEELPRPRLGFYGVIDERFDTALLDAAAAMHELVGHRDQAVLLLGQAVDAGTAAGHVEARPRQHHIVRRQLQGVGDGEA